MSRRQATILQNISAAWNSLTGKTASTAGPRQGTGDVVNAGKSGSRVSADTLLSLSAVWRAVNIISQHVGALPFNLMKISGNGRSPLLGDSRQSILRWQACPEMHAFDFRQTVTAQAMLRGNGYAYIVRDKYFQPIEIWPLPPDSTCPVRIRSTAELWYLTWINGIAYKFAATDCLHIHGLSGDGMIGYSVVRYMAEDGGLALATRDYASRFFNNDATPGGTLEVPAALSETAFKRLKDSWNAAHMGFDKAHRTAILEEGTKFAKMSFNAEEAELINARKFSVLDISNFFGVPPHKLGDATRSSHGSLEAENQSFLDDGLNPWLLRWESEARSKLLTESEKDEGKIVPEFDRKALVKADMAARAGLYSSAVGGPWMTPNEARDTEGLPPQSDGDVLYKPANTNGGAAAVPKTQPVADNPLESELPAKKSIKKEAKP